MIPSQTSRPYTAADFLELKQLSNPQFSPDNIQIVFVITKPCSDSNNYKDHIVIVNMVDNTILEITQGSSPSWSPNGQFIAYMGSEEGKDGVWIYDVHEGVKDFIAYVYESSYFIDHMASYNFAWSPDGEKIAYVSSDGNSDEREEVRVIDSLMYKSKGGRSRPYYAGKSPSDIWLVSIKDKKPINLTPDEYHEHSISWSPDGKKIVFVCNRTSDFDYNHFNKLYTVDIISQKIEALEENQVTVYNPTWSPGGQHIAYLGNSSVLNSKDSPSEDYHLFVKSLTDGSERCLTKSLDRRVENIQWQEDDNSIYFTSGNQGTTTIYKVEMETLQISKILNGEFHISEYSVGKSGKSIAFISSNSVEPPELHLLDVEDSISNRLTSVNESLMDRKFQPAVSFWYDSFDHTQIQGWITKPAEFEANRKYPMILVIHGGPHNMFGNEFQNRVQLLSGEGYGVLCINPRGSSGYGQNFSRGSTLNWGGRDFKDLMKGVDFIIDQHDWIDSERLGVTGQSYGGYMTNWIITQTRRFKAAVSDGGISNLISFTGTSVFHLLLEDEFDGKPWERYPLLWQWSPLRNVERTVTPTLFLHGETDNEVPMSQTEEMFTALKKLGVETQFVQYVGEGHGWRPDLKPKNRIDLFNRMVDWFNTHLK